MTEQRVQRRLAAILAADVVGYSALMERNEEATYAEFERLKRELIEPSLARHGASSDRIRPGPRRAAKGIVRQETDMGSDVHTARILTVRLGGEVFAIPAGIVREILDVGRVTPVPTAPAFACNLINVRGRVVPLANLRLRFGMPAVEPTMDTRIVVLEIDLEGEPTTVAVLADKVYEVTQLDEVVSTDVPGIGTRWRPEFVVAIGRCNGQFVMVLDIDRVFAAAGEVHSMEES